MWKRGFNKIMNKKQISFKQRFGLTILLLVLYRLCSHIPLPFVNKDYVQAMIDSNGSLGILNTLTGGNLGNMSIVALGITPYITASIVLQLMGVLIPSLSDMQKEDEESFICYNEVGGGGKNSKMRKLYAEIVANSLIVSKWTCNISCYDCHIT